MPHALQERSSAHCERFAALRQHYDLIACAWCQKPIRWKRKATAAPCEVSHGICAHCESAATVRLKARWGMVGTLGTLHHP
jgi:hypothetical protein